MGPAAAADDTIEIAVGAESLPAPESESVAVEADSRPSIRVPKKGPEDELADLKRGLKATRGGFIAKLTAIFRKEEQVDPTLLDEIEEILISADIGVRTTDRILEKLRTAIESGDLTTHDGLWSALRDEARAIFETNAGALDLTQSPSVILVVGVNGVGKTTTIGKLASRFSSEGKKVVLAAGDTFRAAAVLQLEVWGRRTGCTVVKGKDNADPGSVLYDAIQQGKAVGADIVIADTAGRLHTKVPLMEELAKVYRTCEKALGRAPDEVLLVLDSTTGQNAIQQVQIFRDALPLSGIALTKLDGTAKGGVVLGIVDQHAIPVRFIGLGEKVDDLKTFDAEQFVEALFDRSDDESLAA